LRGALPARTVGVADRIQVLAFELDTLDWWDLMRASDLVVSSLCLHHLNDAKKQYLYKAIAERLTARGALLIADLVEPAHPAARLVAADSWDASARAQADAARAPEQLAAFVESRWNHFRFPDSRDRPSALFHQFVWLKHAGFAVVDCCWLFAGHAVYGGFKAVDGPSAGNGIAFERALTTVRARLSRRMSTNL
jgi:tRNA (cmo5U34)-methyltransferase